MKKDIVIIEDGELWVGTFDLSVGFHVDHRSVKLLIDKYKDDFEEVGECPMRQKAGKVSSFKMTKPSPKGGRPTIEYFLNEPQSTYLITLLRNNEIIRKFKKHLTKSFFKQRKLLAKLLAQKHNAEWIEKRDAGKIERRAETDEIKKFVMYAKGQGSQHAEKYYMIISKMENQTLFNLDFLSQKFPNLRDVVSGFALDALKMADHVVAKALREGMELQMDYKQIYKLAKQRVEIFTEVLGKMPIHIALKDPRSLDVATIPTHSN